MLYASACLDKGIKSGLLGVCAGIQKVDLDVETA